MKEIDLKSRMKVELSNILKFWMTNAIDINHGGFVAQMSNNGDYSKTVEKGGVLNARILWTFSAAYNFTNQTEYLGIAQRAFDYIKINFIDVKYGGSYWSLNQDGSPANKRKQIYALAFTIYGLSEYAHATQNEEAFDLAFELYHSIEKYSYDPTTGGYKEAFSNSWKELQDLRLSPKDRNDPKTMNTHLHIIEAYANLYKHKPNEELKKQIIKLLGVFEHKIIDSTTYHMNLFFDKNWVSQATAISYGHDIEASWLLLECAEIVGDRALITKWEGIAVKMVDAAAQGLNKDGSLYHEFDPVTQHKDNHREWWVSAEAMVGFYNAYHITGDVKYLNCVLVLWSFIDKYILDHKNGEWLWGLHSDYSVMQEDKIGPWKCPYHNARACMELIDRIGD